MDYLNNTTQLPVYSVEQIRELEHTAIDDHGIQPYDLMQRAGASAFKIIKQNFPDASKILVITGSGNNGGDGYVIARLATQAGIDCKVMPLVTVTKLRDEVARAHNDFAIADGIDIELNENFPDCDLIIDAIFGIGANRPIENSYADIIQAINRTPVPVVALDVPSGLNADTGNALGTAVYANLTITFIGIKSGLVTGQARDYTGDIVLETLDLPETAISTAKKLGNTTTEYLRSRLLPPRKASSYKNNFGHVLIIGGNRGYPNAARLAGEAAARTGAGLVSVFSHPDSMVSIATGCAALMTTGSNDIRVLNGLLKKATVVVLGPGLGQDSWAKKMFACAIETKLPIVIDADALHLLSRNAGRNDHWILTPHPGEAASLLSCSKEDIETDRISAALAMDEQYGGVSVLKGAGTISCHQQKLSFSTHGNASLATGGSGDVLTGIIAALIAQGASNIDAANCGVMIHALAAERSSTDGTRGILPTDLFPALYKLVNPCHE